MDIQEPTSLDQSRLNKPIIDIAVGIVVGIMVKVIELQMPSQWGRWPRLTMMIVFILVGLYVIYALWRLLAPSIRDWQCDRRIEQQIREPMLSVASVFNDAMSQGFVRGAANILHPLNDLNIIDARLRNQFLVHIATLHSAGGWIVADVQGRSLPAADGLLRLLDMHRDYIRICSSLANAASAANRLTYTRHGTK